VAAARQGRPGAVYNIGGSRPVELTAAIGTIAALTGRPLELLCRPAPIGEARCTGCDGSRALAELGFEAHTDLQDGLAAQLEWMLDAELAGGRT
jgi:nucleoside-diphosphate-sugar epimerase